ncbi:hypothetical protein QYE76_071629 [Lolium multiflorum]|uniref:Uncharacterized protein n=1 Tax=Lolium multiflorum TaxID=4521 RepID=A0AAD8WH07_LOLMU|nr:hypothetical protein QYE76_071629 [Lolium multiflorum]
MEIEEDEVGIDLQGGGAYLSDDDDFEEDDFTEDEDYAFLEPGPDDVIPIDIEDEDFKIKFSKYHVPRVLSKRCGMNSANLSRMTVVEYRDRFLTPSRYAPDETDTTEKRQERFLNGLHDEMQTVLVNIPFADLEALVDSAIQMEGKLNQANENRNAA